MQNAAMVSIVEKDKQGDCGEGRELGPLHTAKHAECFSSSRTGEQQRQNSVRISANRIGKEESVCSELTKIPAVIADGRLH